MSASRPLPFFFFGSSVTTGVMSGGSSTLSLSAMLLDVLGKLRFSQSSAVLGIGASFSLLTRLKFLLGDLPALVIFETSSMGSARALARLWGFWRREASSVVLIMGPFLFARRGCGGRGTDSLRGAGGGSSCAKVVAADCFLDRLGGRLGKPPVESGTLRGEVDDVRDCVSEASVRAGETSRDTDIGGSRTGTGGDGALRVDADLSTLLFLGRDFRTVLSGGGDFDFVA